MQDNQNSTFFLLVHNKVIPRSESTNHRLCDSVTAMVISQRLLHLHHNKKSPCRGYQSRKKANLRFKIISSYYHFFLSLLLLISCPLLFSFIFLLCPLFPIFPPSILLLPLYPISCGSRVTYIPHSFIGKPHIQKKKKKENP